MSQPRTHPIDGLPAAPAPHPPRIAIGVGCRKGCPAAAIEALVRQALGGTLGGAPAAAHGLFTISDKRGEPNLVEAAEALGLKLVFLSRDALRSVTARVATRSARVETLFGVKSVAEASALVGAGPGSALLVARIASQGATCAIAAGRDDLA